MAEEKKCFVPQEFEHCGECLNRHECRDWAQTKMTQVAPQAYLAGNCKNFEKE